MSDREAFEKIERKFTSSNSVDVERSTILRVEWELAKQYITEQASRQALDGEAVMYTYPEFVADLEGQPEGTATMIPVTRHAGETDLTAPLYTHPASTNGEEVWEKAMMAAIGEDGPESVADAIRRLKAGSVPSVMSERLDVLAQGLENLQRNSGSDAYQWGFVGAVLKDVKSMISDCVPQLEDRLTLGQRKAAQVGKTIGVLVQTPAGSVAAVTDLGRCTWLNQDVTGSGDLVHTCRLSRAMDGTCMSCGSKQEQGQ